MVPAGSDGQNKNHHSSALQNNPTKTTVNMVGSVCPTIIIIKFAKDSSSCKLHRYDAVTTRELARPKQAQVERIPKNHLQKPTCYCRHGSILTINLMT